MVYMFASIDQSQLLWFRLNQPIIWACLCSGLEDAAAQGDNNVDLHTLGQTFFHHLTLVGHITCSSAFKTWWQLHGILERWTYLWQWPLIHNGLKSHKSFFLGRQLMTDWNWFLGSSRWRRRPLSTSSINMGSSAQQSPVYTPLNWGLLCMHILIFLKEPYKLNMTQAIDSYIWAWWPDPETQPLLFETIKRCMVHGPCGAANLNSPCMENGKCTKGYPKPFAKFTTMNKHGFLIYFWPNNGHSYSIGGIYINNQWIVPFCPFLSAACNCHINFECAASLGSFKYLSRYIQKGLDLVSLEINDQDEIKRYTEGHYISPLKAGHHIY